RQAVDHLPPGLLPGRPTQHAFRINQDPADVEGAWKRSVVGAYRIGDGTRQPLRHAKLFVKDVLQQRGRYLTMRRQRRGKWGQEQTRSAQAVMHVWTAILKARPGLPEVMECRKKRHPGAHGRLAVQ